MYQRYIKGIRISEKRLNGLRLRAIQLKRSILSETLDVILNDAGVPELTEQELNKELKKLGKQMEATA